MYTAATTNDSDRSIAQRLRRFDTRITVFFAILVLLYCERSVQAQVVAIALEPTLASFESHPENNVQQTADDSVVDKAERSEQSEVKTAVGRKVDSSSKTQSYIPRQRPIGEVNIDSRPKPKNGNNALPEDIVDVATTSGTVYAATSDQMQEELFYPKSRNHDELFAYQPLYFEEVNLERYGRTCGCLQPVASGVRFFTTIPMLPYAMTVSHPRTAYTRKWPYAAGWGAPRVREFEPIELKPSLVQAGAVTGLVFLLP